MIQPILRKFGKQLRRAVTHKIQLKYSPELIFIHDEEQLKERIVDNILKKRTWK